MNDLIPQEIIEQRIFLVRNQKVMIDRDLAELYGLETKHLNRQVKRNVQRFPEEFTFQLASLINSMSLCAVLADTSKYSASFVALGYAFDLTLSSNHMNRSYMLLALISTSISDLRHP